MQRGASHCIFHFANLIVPTVFFIRSKTLTDRQSAVFCCQYLTLRRALHPSHQMHCSSDYDHAADARTSSYGLVQGPLNFSKATIVPAAAKLPNLPAACMAQMHASCGTYWSQPELAIVELFFLRPHTWMMRTGPYQPSSDSRAMFGALFENNGSAYSSIFTSLSPHVTCGMAILHACRD